MPCYNSATRREKHAMRVRPASAALRRIGFALLLLLGADFAAAQTYPSRPIRIVVPLPPGANGDLMPRILAQHLSAKFGQPVVIENRPGAAQNLGAELVFRAGARRLHAVRHAAGAAGDQPELLSEARLRSDAVRADHDHGEAALHPGGPSQGAGVERSPSSSPTPRPIPTSSTTPRPRPAAARI